MTRLTVRELATVLAALRYWRQDLIVSTDEGDSEPIDERLDGLTHLTPREIDALSERLSEGAVESSFEIMCRQVTESAENWADCSDLCQAAAVFKEFGQRCRELLAAAGRNDKPCRGFVLYDFDQRSLVTTTVFDSYQEAAEGLRQRLSIEAPRT